MAKKKPVIKPKIEEMNKDIKLTFKDNIMISYNFKSRENINLKEFIIISKKFIIIIY